MEYLFLVNIGPVQGFIATARRSRDLWYGSWWLSELSRAVALTILDEPGPASLIFPAPDAAEELTNKFRVVNRILARISTQPQALAVRAEAALYKRLDALREDAFKDLKPHMLATKDDALGQVKDLPEFFWVALPLENEADYSAVRGRLESLMAARKVTRTFGAVTWGSTAPKSSLDGLRESVIPPTMYPDRREPTDERQRKVDSLYTRFKAGPAEQLSGVDLLKRLGKAGTEAAFPSTSHVAALPLLHCLAQEKGTVHPLWPSYEGVLRTAKVPLERLASPYDGAAAAIDRFDGSLLFEERLFEEQPKDLLDKDVAKVTREKLREFLQAAAGVSRPLPYYAILLADGDGMGKTIDAQKRPEDHRALSKGLDEFAEEVRNIVEMKHTGALIFAGGDDVLAFLPLHTALACAKALHSEFGTRLNGFAYKDDGGKDAHPTLSVGIAISHHLEPLSDALELARAAEKAAKGVSGKNALAVTVSKRSGADRTVRGKWGTLDEQLDWLIGLHRIEAIPSGAAYELEDMMRHLSVPSTDPAFKTLQDALLSESVRILRRKKVPGGKEGIRKDRLAKLEASLKGQLSGESSRDERPLGDLAQEMIVARLFADAMNMAKLLQPTSSESASPPVEPAIVAHQDAAAVVNPDRHEEG